MASLRLKFEPPFGAGSLLLSLGLHLAVVALVLMAGWQKPQVASPILEVSLVALPGEPGSPGPDAGGSASGDKAPAAQPAPVPKVAAKPVPKPAAPPASRHRARPQSPPPVKAEAALPQPKPAAPSPPAYASLSDRPSAAEAGSRESFGGAGGAAASGAAGSRAGGGDGSERSRGGPGRGGGSGGLAAAQNQYLSLIRARILAHRHYPPLARARQMEGVVRLRFTLAANGALNRGVQIVTPSGFTVLDEQASQCVLAAAPFPPFPAELQRDSLTVEVPIVYQLKDWAG
jgi:periplasmic protein TonB